MKERRVEIKKFLNFPNKPSLLTQKFSAFLQSAPLKRKPSDYPNKLKLQPFFKDQPCFLP